LAKIDRASAGLAKGRAGAVPLTVGEVLASVGRKTSAEKLFFYVRDNISFEPYEGNQRGVRGTLISRSGNSVDQAALLRELLEMEKIPARYAFGRLSAADAALRLRGTVGSATLAGRGLPPKTSVTDPSKDRAVLNAARSAVWVEAQVKGKWVPLDPSNPSAIYGVAPTVKSGASDGIPEEARVDLIFKVVAKDATGAEADVFSAKVPLSEVAYRNTSFTFVESAGSLLPRVVLAGKARDGEKFTKAKLARLTLELLFDRGGKTVQKLTRDLMLKGSLVDLFDTDQQVFSVVITPGWVSENFVAQVAAQGVGGLAARGGEVRKVVSGKLDKTATVELDAYLRDVLEQSAGLIALTMALISDQTTVAFAKRLGVRPFFSEPRVTIVAAVRDDDRFMWHVDLRSDEVTALPAQGLPPELADALQVARGALDAELAARVTTDLTGQAVISVGQVFQLASRENNPLSTIFAGNSKALAKTLKVSNEARARLVHLATRSGRAAVVPQRPVVVGGAKFSVWWALIPGTGAVVGTREDGSQGTFSEALLDGVAPRRLRGGEVAVLAFDESVSLLEHLTDGVKAVLASGPPAGCNALCTVSDPLRTFAAGLCGSGAAKAQACLAVNSGPGTSDLLGKTQTCDALTYRTTCGAAVGLEGLDGAYSIVDDVRPSKVGPWSNDALPKVGLAECRCSK
jgi:hypothetical protein